MFEINRIGITNTLCNVTICIFRIDLILKKYSFGIGSGTIVFQQSHCSHTASWDSNVHNSDLLNLTAISRV